MTDICFIGFGEVGRRVSEGLREERDITISAFDIAIDDAMRCDAKRIGVSLTNERRDAISGAELILSSVKTDRCVEAAEQCAEYVSSEQIWCDLNSCSPGNKRKAAAALAHTGVRYTDTAVMSDIPRPRHRAPLYLAGPDASDTCDRLNTIGMNARLVGDQIGQAATIKMCRSVFLKGFDAVLFECLAAATEVGVRDQVIESIHDTFPDFNIPTIAGPKMNRLAQHCERRSGEMRFVDETLTELGLNPVTPITTSRVLERMSRADCPEIANPAKGELEELARRYLAFAKADPLSESG